jgi:lysophospholipase L1-like esterase
MSSRIKRIILTAAAIIATLFIVEGLLRLATPPEFLQSSPRSTVWPWVVTDPILGWANSAGFENNSIRINSNGFRGEEISPEKKDGVTRIVCIGDSGTFGLWFGRRARRYWDSYPEELSRILKENGYENVEVINTGVVGYTSSHTLRQLMTYSLALEPDILVARLGFNDIADLDHEFFRAYYVKEPPGFLIGSLMYRWPESRLVRLAALLDRKLVSMSVKADKNVVSHEEFRANLERIVEASEKRDVDLLFIDYPLREPGTGLHKQERYLSEYYGVETLSEFHEKHGAYQEILSDVARDRGVEIVDTASAMRKFAGPSFSEYDFVHPNASGARIVALEVYIALVELGWIPEE